MRGRGGSRGAGADAAGCGDAVSRQQLFGAASPYVELTDGRIAVSVALDARVQAARHNAQLLEALQALVASGDHTKPQDWRRDRPVSLALAAIAAATGDS